MTTIVYKDGILAGDTKFCEGQYFSDYSSKIFDLPEFLVGIAGFHMLYGEFLKFLKGDSYREDVFKQNDICFCAIVIEKKTGDIFRYDKELIKTKHNLTFVAIGSGSEIAKGALLMGATAKQAVECAAKIDLHTGGEIQEIILSNNISEK